MVFFAAEKSRSTSEDIAGIDRISMAIRDNEGNRVRWAMLVHYSRAIDVPILVIPSVMYRSSSSLITGPRMLFTYYLDTYSTA